MQELPLSYLKDLAEQMVFISAFLGGFAASILGTLIFANSDQRILKVMIAGAALSAISFIVTVFAMTNIIITSHPDYPLKIDPSDVNFGRLAGSICFFLGLLALIFVVACSGWVYSKRLGVFTTIIGILGVILVLLSS